MRGPHVRFCERREGVILRAYSTRRSVRTGAGAPRFRASPTVQPGQAELPIGRPPLVEQLAGDPELPRNLRQTLPSPEPENRRFLERRRKYTPPRRLAWVEATAEPLPCGTARPTWDVSWFGWKGPFLRPGLTIPRRRAQPRSRMAEGDRACAARSVLDGGEHDARLDQGGPIEGTRRARA